MVAASLVFAFIILQNHFGLTERLQRWRNDFSSSDLRNKNYQLNFDVAGQKGTISIKTQPSQDPDPNKSKKPQKPISGQHKKVKSQPQETAQSGAKSP
jgi:hypothetical protein